MAANRRCRPNYLKEIIQIFGVQIKRNPLLRDGLNVLSVEHHRAGIDLHLDKVQIQLTLETRGAAHSEEIVESLRADGIHAERVG